MSQKNRELREDFQKHLNQDLLVQINDEEYQFTLVEVESLKHSLDDESYSFRLLFYSPFKVDRFYNQGIFSIQMDTENQLPVFMVPIGPNEDGNIQYEAIFN